MANWINDPQEREEVEKVTQELKLPIFKPNAKGKFRSWLTEVWGKIEDYLINLKNIANSKEPLITKKSGFNLDKTNITENVSNKLFTAKGALDLFNRLTTAISTAVENAKTALRMDIAKKIDKTSKSDSVTSNSSETIATSLAVKTAYDRGSSALIEANKKEPIINKNTGFNKPFGATQNTVLEGSKFTQITGKDYGGLLNSPGLKIAGKAYFDNNTKKLYICKNDNTDISANVNNYIPFDSHSLLERLENLNNFKNWKVLVDKYWNYDKADIPIPTDATEVLFFNRVADTSASLPTDWRVDNTEIIPLDALKKGINIRISDLDAGGDNDYIILRFNEQNHSLIVKTSNANMWVLIYYR